MLIKIEDVQVGDYVSVPLYLVENTRLPYTLFQVSRITFETNDKGQRWVLYDKNDKPLLMREAGAFVQYRGRMRDGITLYKTGDRLPAGDLRLLVVDDVIDTNQMVHIHDVLTNFQFIEYDKSSIRYELDHGFVQNYIMFYFLHLDTHGEVHVQLSEDDDAYTTLVTYEAESGERKGSFYHDPNELRNIHLT